MEPERLPKRLERINTPEIQPLTPERLNDVLHFFDHDAFVDNPAWESCYCFCYLFTGPEEEWAARSAAENRAGLADAIICGKAEGWLAYVGGRLAGWCNAAPRQKLAGLNRFADFRVDDAEGIGSIVCYVIAVPYRRHGLARLLLDAACEGFRRQGLAYAEAYPPKQPQSDAAAYHGPLSIYLEAGFQPYRELAHHVIVRKPLR